MFRYSQYCPIAKSAEILGDRWTILIVRELLFGVRRFNQFDRGLPGISRSVLSDRLKRLDDMGIVERRQSGPEGFPEYHLTEVGRGLKPVVHALGDWAARWFISDPQPSETDPDLLMLAIGRHLQTEVLPEHRVVVEFELETGNRRRLFWLVFQHREASLCLQHPGFEPDLIIKAGTDSLYRVYMGRLDWSEALRRRMVTIEGPRRLARAFPSWMAWSSFSDTVRESRTLPTTGRRSAPPSAERSRAVRPSDRRNLNRRPHRG